VLEETQEQTHLVELGQKDQTVQTQFFLPTLLPVEVVVVKRLAALHLALVCLAALAVAAVLETQVTLVVLATLHLQTPLKETMVGTGITP